MCLFYVVLQVTCAAVGSLGVQFSHKSIFNK
jgi:hypothetical protein